VHGVSIKQGKKVKQRLEKVGPIREELRSATRPPLSKERLEAAMGAARGVVGMLEATLLEHANAVAARIAEIGEEAASAEMAEAEESEVDDSEGEQDSEPEAREGKHTPVAVAPPPPPPRRPVMPWRLSGAAPSISVPRPTLPRSGWSFIGDDAGSIGPDVTNCYSAPGFDALRRLQADLSVSGVPPSRASCMQPSAAAREAMFHFPHFSMSSAEPPATAKPAPPPPPDPQQHLLGASLVDALDGSPTAQVLKPPQDQGDSKANRVAPPPVPSPPPASRVPAPHRTACSSVGPPPSVVSRLAPSLPASPHSVVPRLAPCLRAIHGAPAMWCPRGGGVKPPRPPLIEQSAPPPPPLPGASAMVAPPRPRNGVNPLRYVAIRPNDRGGGCSRPPHINYDSASSLGGLDLGCTFPGLTPEPCSDSPRRLDDLYMRHLSLSTHAEPFTPAASNVITHNTALSIHPPNGPFLRPLIKGTMPATTGSDPVLPVALGALPVDPFRMNSPPPPGRIGHSNSAHAALDTMRRGLSIDGMLPRHGGLGGSLGRPLAAEASSPRVGVDNAFVEQMLEDLLDDD
jgi:hypothetical protein